MAGLDDDVKADERNDNRSDSDSDDMFSSRKTIHENGYEQPVETAYIENAVEELGQVCLCLIITWRRQLICELFVCSSSFDSDYLCRF